MHNINAGPYLSKYFWTTKPEKFEYYPKLPTDVQKLIAEYAGINAPMELTGYLYSPLQDAITHRDYDRVKVLVALHADVNGTPAQSNETPLCRTIREYEQAATNLKFYRKHDDHDIKDKAKLYAIFKYLLIKGADYNKANPEGICSTFCKNMHKQTPLHVAVNNMHTMALLQDLLNLPNINLHVQDRWGHTALDCAKLKAMNQFANVEYRKHYYKTCILLESKNTPSSVILEPMPSEKIMNQQYEDALRIKKHETQNS